MGQQENQDPLVVATFVFLSSVILMSIYVPIFIGFRHLKHIPDIPHHDIVLHCYNMTLTILILYGITLLLSVVTFIVHRRQDLAENVAGCSLFMFAVSFIITFILMIAITWIKNSHRNGNYSMIQDVQLYLDHKQIDDGSVNYALYTTGLLVWLPFLVFFIRLGIRG